jgi:sugar phosphate isomerase/epimerase
VVVDFARKRHRQSLEAAAIAGCQYLVLHSDVHARARAFNTGDDWAPILAAHFRELARVAASHGVSLLIENTFETDARALVDLVRLTDEPNVGISLDVGHAFVSNARPLDDWVWQLQPYLWHVHLHDNDGAYDRHWPLGRGVIDFWPFFTALDAVEAPPLVVMEVADHTAMWDSVDVLVREGRYTPACRTASPK